MDECPKRKASGCAACSRIGSRLRANQSGTPNAHNQCSKRVGNSTRLYATKFIETGNIEKAENLTTTSSSIASMPPCRNPSIFSASVKHQKALPEQENKSFTPKGDITKRRNGKVKTDVPKCTGRQMSKKGAQCMPKTARISELALDSEYTVSGTQDLPKDATGVLETCSAASTKITRRQISQRPGFGNLYASTISSMQRLIASRDSKQATRNFSHNARSGAQKCDQKKNCFPSFSKVIAPDYSCSISASTRVDMAKKMCIEGDASASSSKKMSASSNKKLSGCPSTRLATLTSLNASRTTNKSKINDPPGSSSSSVDTGRKEFSRRGAHGRKASCSEGWLDFESNLFLGDILNYYDQHRAMRMDIDNLSYEELLDLEEKMGSVSTGLSDEALAECIKRSNFKQAPSPSGITGCVVVSSKCSICQEECVDGEEIGLLACEHWYHVLCIQQWLKQKNWCPICKASAYIRSK